MQYAIPVVAECQSFGFDSAMFSMLGALLNFWTDIIVLRHLVAKCI